MGQRTSLFNIYCDEKLIYVLTIIRRYEEWSNTYVFVVAYSSVTGQKPLSEGEADNMINEFGLNCYQEFQTRL